METILILNKRRARSEVSRNNQMKSVSLEKTESDKSILLKDFDMV